MNDPARMPSPDISPVNVLLVDDNPRNLDALESILQLPGYQLIRAASGDEALLALMKDDFAAIVLDIQMPNMSGLEVARLVKRRKRSEHIPILFLTAHYQEDDDILKGYGVGAVDYLTKPINPLILKSKLGVFVDLYRATRALTRANRALEQEVTQRKEAQAVQHRLNEELEVRVRERTDDLHRANEALAQSEEQFRRAIEGAPIPVIMQAQDGQVLQISRAWERLTGHTLKDMPTFDAWLASACRHGARDIGAAFRGLFERDRGMEEVEFEVTTRTGQRRIWAFSASSPGTLRDGRRFVVGTAIDITERKKAEDLLRQSEERYRHLVYTLPAAVYTCDAEGTILLFNRAAVELWGREPETGVDKWCGSWRIFYPDGTPMPVDQCPMSEAIRTGRGIDGREIVIERPDGSRSSVMVYPHPVRDSSGAITGAVNMLVDITERKRSEESLRESRNAERTHRQELEALMQAAPAAMLIARDPDCDQITGNPTAYSMLRMSPGENMSKSAAVPTAASHFEVYCDGKLLPTEEMPIQKAARTGQPVENQELEWRFRDGTSTWVYGSTTPLFDDRSRVRGAVSTFVDITRLKRTEAALREAKAETEAASKAKDDFLATLSHELRTPLSPAILLASEWENNPTLPADARNAFAAIRKDIELEARLIDDLLDLTRVAHGKLRFTPEIADVHELLRETWVLLRPEAGEKQVKIRYELGAPVKWVKGDAVRLQQVFWNVIRNAVRFSPSGGMITIRTRGGERGRILIEIADRGTGIDKADHEKIFMPFSQGHRGTRAGALGLGLAISRSLVELHGGKIAVSSAGVGTGATFSIDLPVATEARSTIRTEEPVPSPVSSALRPRRILLVEDHTQTRNTLTKLLVRRGHEVVAAESARQAREIASTFEFDLVLSDLGLPDGSGHDLMADLRRLRPMCRGIALSGYGMESDIKRSRDAGFDIHLTKPIDVSTLESALRQAGNSHGIREF